MLAEFRRPTWCQEVVVTADAACASRANLATIQALGYWYTRALPRTWQFAQGKAVKDRGTPLPHGKYPPMRLPTVNTPRRRTVWGYAKRVQLRPLGHVTVVLHPGRRHAGPKQSNILVTHVPATVTAREMVGVSLRRWWIALLRRALKGVGGVGQQQVTKHVDRVERSVAVAIMADLLLLKLRAQDLPGDRPWSAFRLQPAWAWAVIQEPCERSARHIARTWLQMRKAA